MRKAGEWAIAMGEALRSPPVDIAVDSAKIIEDIGVQQIDRLALLDPAVDFGSPAVQAVATGLFLGHHAAEQ